MPRGDIRYIDKRRGGRVETAIKFTDMFSVEDVHFSA